MARRLPGAVVIDWSDMGDTSRLDELLEQLLLPSELDYFDSGYVRSREWVELVSASAGGTDFDWLLAAATERVHGNVVAVVQQR